MTGIKDALLFPSRNICVFIQYKDNLIATSIASLFSSVISHIMSFTSISFWWKQTWRSIKVCRSWILKKKDVEVKRRWQTILRDVHVARNRGYARSRKTPRFTWGCDLSIVWSFPLCIFFEKSYCLNAIHQQYLTWN